MNIEIAKQIGISDYLHSLGYSPVKQQGDNLWYKSPFRDEYEPSFKVNTSRNLWYDFGAGKGGNIIALAQELYGSGHLSYLLEKIAEQAPHIRPVSFSFGKQSSSQPSFKRLEVEPLSSPALLGYLRDRGINTELAKTECKELHFQHNDKSYFAIGFVNASGGYEVRNKFFKGCISPKDITHIRQQGEPKDTCFVFEGFMDYLSFLTIRQEKNPNYPCLDWQDYIILNSTANVSKALYPLGSYNRIHCLLDNDAAGRKAVEAIHNEYGIRVRDSSHLYRGHKDLNEYLTGKPLNQKAGMTQPTRQTQQTQPAARQEQQPVKKKGKGFKM